MSTWVEVVVFIVGAGGTLVVNAALISWQVGRHYERFDQRLKMHSVEFEDYKLEFDRQKQKLETLQTRFAAYTGIANGIDFREKEN